MARRSNKSGRSGGERELTVRVKTARGRTTSSQKWLQRQLNDPYVAAARRAGYRSRAAFKLLEIDDKHKLLKRGFCLIDLGASPGGWTQIAVERVKSQDGEGQVIAIDISEMEGVPGAEVIHLDFMDEQAPERLISLMNGEYADIVLSDMAAPATGHSRTDHLRIMGLAEAAAYFAKDVLRPGGAFLCKVFQGGTEKGLLNDLKRDYEKVQHVKPPASRSDSSELYVLATGFRGERNPELPD